MTNKGTQLRAKDKERELDIQHVESDSPMLPVAQLEDLHKFRPDLVDWLVGQTQKEAEYRRREQCRINTFIFVERILGQVLAFLLGVIGIAGGGYIALHGQPWAGGMIATAAITGLAVAFLRGKSKGGGKTPTASRPST
ncbi:MAG: hypothetical protein FWD79_10690 [Desulfobulbus sp.]|nr:hypothetical protein [Desulfobulbus sp.]